MGLAGLLSCASVYCLPGEFLQAMDPLYFTATAQSLDEGFTCRRVDLLARHLRL